MANGDSPEWPGGQNPPAQQPPGSYGQPQYPQTQPPQYPPPPGQYPPPQYGAPPFQPKTNGLAVASLVLGILWVCSLGSILAVIFGYMAMKQIDESQGRETGRGLALAGVVLGWIGVAFLVLYIVLLAVGAATFEYQFST